MSPQPSGVDPPAPNLSVVIPFYNEAPNVGALLQEVRAVLEAMPGTQAEVIAVDDGSTDGTAAALAAAAAAWSELRVLSKRDNGGQASALWSGFAAARGGVIVTLDGDGQNDPAEIPNVVAALVDGVDMVAGVRARREDSWLRRRMSRLANGVRSRVLRDGVRDSGCALKAFRREVCGSFLPLRTLYSFMPALAVAAGYRVIEKPVHHRHRTAGVSKYGLGAMLWRPLVDMIGVWWFTRRRFPHEHA